MVKQEIIKSVYEQFTWHWDDDDAMRYSPILFPYVEPDQKVRTALKALICIKQKDQRFWELRRLIDTENSHYTLREIKRPSEKENLRTIKTSPNEEREDSIPTLISQKGNINITLDINELNSSIYGECKECIIRETCKEAFGVVTEYVSYSLNKLDFEITT